ncbi:hypothetical protein ACOSP7_023127 [Xanthoceras sorbifolium]|uniref:EF-hand domain-containing protein n=1 Tax=Xanthoceras sorbifolium TaxID=99658 RepID=A0ABQ8HQD6_9ROSI|nr:hypothetical protein JRO89_XS08G0190600 [Xanthoceras sorbifolium]
MSKVSFLNFRYSLSRKSFSLKSPQLSFSSKERQKSNVSRATQPNVEEMRWVFDKFDTNKDGKISREEYKAALKLLGKGTAEPNEVAKSFQFVDTDGDGFIDFKEFMEMMQNNMGDGVKKTDIHSAFKMFDTNGDGKISAEELMQVLKNIGERCSLDSCRKMIRGVDADGDGLIDMDEFMNMMTRNMKVS